MTLLYYVPPKLLAKRKHVEPASTTSIILVSVAIFLIFILLTYIGLKFTENTIKQYNTCREKIVGFEQRGMYSSPDQFKLALSYCDVG